MAFVEADLDEVEAAIASALRSGSYEGKSVEYPDLEDLRARREMIRRSLEAESTNPRVRTFKFKTSPGFEA